MSTITPAANGNFVQKRDELHARIASSSNVVTPQGNGERTYDPALDQLAPQPSKPAPLNSAYRLNVQRQPIDHLEDENRPLLIPRGQPSPVDAISFDNAAPPAIVPENAIPGTRVGETVQPVMPQPLLAREVQPQLSAQPVESEAAIVQTPPEQHALLLAQADALGVKQPLSSGSQASANPDSPTATPNLHALPQASAGETIAPAPDQAVDGQEPSASSDPTDANLANLIQFRRLQKKRQLVKHAA